MRFAHLACAGIVATTFLLGGCAGTQATPAAATESTSVAPAPLPTVTESTGSIAGVIVDDEGLPLLGATASIVELKRDATTDELGNFTFNDVEQGAYTMFFNKLGYEQNGKKVEVVAGEVTPLRVTLAPVNIDLVPYTRTDQRVGLIHVGESIAHTLIVQTVNVSVVNQLTCDPCRWVVFLEKAPKEVLTEITWPNTSPAEPINADVFVYYKITWSGGWYIGDNDADTVIPAYMTNRDSFSWPEAQVKKLKEKDRLLLVINPSYVLSFEHKPTIYTSFAYNADFDEEFSALPPP